MPHSFWWAIVSMTTTGYGDETPVTFLGKVEASVSMCFGILLIALPVAIVGSEFQNAYARMEYEKKLLSSKRLSKEPPAPAEPVPAGPSVAVDASALPDLRPVLQSVPPSHPAAAGVQRVVERYAELSQLHGEISRTRQAYRSVQQELSRELATVLASAAPRAAT